MSADQKLLEKVLLVIEKRLDDEQFNVTKLCREAGVSRAQLYRRLQALQQLPANELIRAARLRRAKALLQQTRLAIAEVAYRVGFGSAAYFTQCFREAFGVTPSQFRKTTLRRN